MLDGVALAMVPTVNPEDLLAACTEFVSRAGLVRIYPFDFRRAARDGKYFFRSERTPWRIHREGIQARL